MIKVYPRDLFNDANLLKCVGQIALIELERGLPGNWELHIPTPYTINMSELDGSTNIQNMFIRNGRRDVLFSRPLNSREAWPLTAHHGDYEECEVFDDKGNFAKEFINLLEQEE